MDRYRLIAPMLPDFEVCLRRSDSGADGLKEAFFLNLARMDQRMMSENLERADMLRHLTEDLLIASGAFEVKDPKTPLYSEVVEGLKSLLRPLVQPNRDVEEAVRLMFANRGLKLPRRPGRRRKKKIRKPEELE